VDGTGVRCEEIEWHLIRAGLGILENEVLKLGKIHRSQLARR
jgi:hypothetical protein